MTYVDVFIVEDDFAEAVLKTEDRCSQNLCSLQSLDLTLFMKYLRSKHPNWMGELSMHTWRKAVQALGLGLDHIRRTMPIKLYCERPLIFAFLPGTTRCMSCFIMLTVGVLGEAFMVLAGQICCMWF
jgi:hypothetical protein